LSPAAYSAMSIENRSYLEEAECQQFDKLFRELVQTIGAVSTILDCAASVPSESQAKYLQLAREASTRGTRTLKKVLWQWAGLRKDFAEEKTARSSEAVIEAPKPEIRQTDIQLQPQYCLGNGPI
jgi:hypothetical protein